MKKVFVLNKNGEPLMPTDKYGKVRRLIKDGKAEIHSHEPFTIKLLYDTPEFVQPITVGVDTGYSYVGISAVTKKVELFGCELELRNDIKDLITSRSSYRTNRRNQLRYRKKRFDFRTRKDGWLPPSTQHKFDSNIKLITKYCDLLPNPTINIETANFDIQKIMNPDISGVGYQEGEQLGFYNVRQYVLYRDGHKCQNPNCENTDKNKILKLHHIIYTSEGGTNKPNNLITVCNKCHTTKNHKPGGFLYDWMKNGYKTKTYKDSTFMNILKSRIVNNIKDIYPNLIINETSGHITKSNRYINNIPKSHHNDAFVIAGGIDNNKISETINLKCERRNNRSLETFRDAKYIDSRDGEIKPAQKLNCGRVDRNKNNNKRNERIFRVPILNEDGTRKEITKGKRSKRTQRYNFNKGSKIKVLVDWSGKKVSVKKGQTFISGGTQGLGTRVYLGKEVIPTKICKEITNRKGIIEKL